MAMSATKNNQPDRAALHARLLAILNEDLSPWTFDGTEPMAARLRAVVDEAMASAERLAAALTRAVRVIQGLEDTISGQPRSDVEVLAELNRKNL